MIIRPIASSDLPALQQMAEESGPGFTSLVRDKALLAEKIQRSVDSFRSPVGRPGNETYLFILEDPVSGEVMGISGIEASAGIQRPLYHFHKSQMVPGNRRPDTSDNYPPGNEVLKITSHYTGCTEICTLFLRPQFRRPNAGKLLSRVRFAFMAQHPERFSDTVIAEMRGVSSPDGSAPFWNWLRPHFADMDFTSVTRKVGAGDLDFIADHCPRHPLHTQLMSPEARAVIGQVHDRTRPALSLLEAEGFRFRGYFDLFDAGPTVEATRSQVRSIAGSTECGVRIVDGRARIADPLENPETPNQLLIANASSEQFRATMTDQATLHGRSGMLEITPQLAESLRLGKGCRARVLEPVTAGADIARRPTPNFHREAGYAVL
ncbi:arginine N-succinyltransferase [Marinobacter sp.]|uniref:arginine N-succinyltransferase n=1 Tax=Marinobacter sp. TaxID=50741 RepID=UPI00384D4C00